MPRSATDLHNPPQLVGSSVFCNRVISNDRVALAPSIVQVFGVDVHNPPHDVSSLSPEPPRPTALSQRICAVLAALRRQPATAGAHQQCFVIRQVRNNRTKWRGRSTCPLYSPLALRSGTGFLA